MVATANTLQTLYIVRATALAVLAPVGVLARLAPLSVRKASQETGLIHLVLTGVGAQEIEVSHPSAAGFGHVVHHTMILY